MKSTAISLLLTLAVVLPAMSQSADSWQEIPGRIEFSGQMIARPVQPEVWQERGFTAAEAAQRNRQADDAQTNELRAELDELKVLLQDIQQSQKAREAP